MTPIVQLRKEQRVVSVASEGSPRRSWQIPTTHISPFVQKILGLKSTGERTAS